MDMIPYLVCDTTLKRAHEFPNIASSKRPQQAHIRMIPLCVGMGAENPPIFPEDFIFSSVV